MNKPNIQTHFNLMGVRYSNIGHLFFVHTKPANYELNKHKKKKTNKYGKKVVVWLLEKLISISLWIKKIKHFLLFVLKIECERCINAMQTQQKKLYQSMGIMSFFLQN